MKQPLFAPYSRKLHPLAVVLSGALLATGSFAGGGQSVSTHVIKIAADGADVIEADISDLQLGESMDFVTDSGQVIDILKAPEGIEIYIDGELLDDHGVHGDLEQLHKRIAIHEEEHSYDCEDKDAESCRAHIEALIENDFDHAEVFVTRHEVSRICDDEGECDTSVSIIADEDMTLEFLSEDADRKVIVIERNIEGELY